MYLRLIVIFFIYLVMFWLGYQRRPLERWAASKYHTSVHHRADAYPVNFGDIGDFFTTNYKILFSVIFYGSFVLLNFLITIIAFPIREMVLSLAMVYLGLFALSVFFIFLGFLFNNYSLGFGLVQSFKKLISTPIISIILIVYFRKFRKVNQTG